MKRHKVRRPLVIVGILVIALIGIGIINYVSKWKVGYPSDTLIVFDSGFDDRAITMAQPHTHQPRYIREFVAAPDPAGGSVYAGWRCFEENKTAIVVYGKRILIYDLASRKSRLFGELGKGKLTSAVWARPLPQSPGYIYTDMMNTLWLSTKGEKPRAVISNCFLSAQCPNESHLITLQRDWTLNEYDINTGKSRLLYQFTPEKQVSYSVRGDKVAVLLRDQIVILERSSRKVIPVPEPDQQIGGIVWVSDDVLVYTKLRSFWTDFVALDLRSNVTSVIFRMSGATTDIYCTHLPENQFSAFPRSPVNLF